MANNKENKEFIPARFNCEKTIYRKFHETIENTDFFG